MNFTGRMALENRVLVQSEGNDMDFYKIIYQNAGDMDTSSEADNITMTNWTFFAILAMRRISTLPFSVEISFRKIATSVSMEQPAAKE